MGASRFALFSFSSTSLRVDHRHALSRGFAGSLLESPFSLQDSGIWADQESPCSGPLSSLYDPCVPRSPRNQACLPCMSDIMQQHGELIPLPISNSFYKIVL